MVYLSRWVCPSGHCLFAAGWCDDEESREAMVAKGEALFRDGLATRKCWTCESTEIEIEETPLPPFKTLEDAKPFLYVIGMMEAAERRRVFALRNYSRN